MSETMNLSKKQDKALGLAFRSGVVQNMGATELREYTHLLCNMSLRVIIEKDGLESARVLVSSLLDQTTEATDENIGQF